MPTNIHTHISPASSHFSLQRGKTYKDLGSIIVDRIGTSHLLAHHKTDRNQGSVAVSPDSPHLALQVPEPTPAGQTRLELELLPHLVQLGLDVFVVGREVAHTPESGGSLLPLIGLCEPAGRLVADHHADREADGGEALHSKRYNPLGVAFRVEEIAVVDPESDTSTGDNLVHAKC